MQRLEDEGLFRQQGLIGGRWVDAASGRTLPVADPATQATLGTVIADRSNSVAAGFSPTSGISNNSAPASRIPPPRRPGCTRLTSPNAGRDKSQSELRCRGGGR